MTPIDFIIQTPGGLQPGESVLRHTLGLNTYGLPDLYGILTDTEALVVFDAAVKHLLSLGDWANVALDPGLGPVEVDGEEVFLDLREAGSDHEVADHIEAQSGDRPQYLVEVYGGHHNDDDEEDDDLAAFGAADFEDDVDEYGEEIDPYEEMVAAGLIEDGAQSPEAKQLEHAAEVAKRWAHSYTAGGIYRVTASELARQIAAEKAAAEARIEAWKASLRTNKGPQS